MPFSEEQFFEVFREYNEAIWPMQAALFLLGVIAVIAAMFSKRVASVIVAALWAWCAVQYHWMHFASVNKAAWIFGAFFLLAAVAILFRNEELFRSENVPEGRRITGFILAGYALIAYPAISHFAGHEYPATPTFGAPCPLTIFTIGLVLMTTRPIPVLPLVVPALWSLFAIPAIVRFGMLEDIVLPFAGAILAACVVSEHHAFRPAPA